MRYEAKLPRLAEPPRRVHPKAHKSVEHDRASKESGWPRDGIRARDALRVRIFPVSDGVPVEVVESGPSIAARLVSLASWLTIRPALAGHCHVVELAATGRIRE